MTIITNRKLILLTMPYAPSARSPPYLSSCWLMNIVTMQEAAFIRNGPRPIESESFAILQSKAKIPFGKWSRLSFLVK